ncbi:hypothetical protein WK25_17520 [Burkholderia latens]|nr:hypothetical protein WK25_17520 [Burkholderia latens]
MPLRTADAMVMRCECAIRFGSRMVCVAARSCDSAGRRPPAAVRPGFPNGKAARERCGFLRQEKARPARRHEAHTFSA